MNMPHIGDTQEFATRTEPASPRRRWSFSRRWMCAGFLLMTLVLILDIAGAPGHRVIEAGVAGSNVIRAAWVISVIAAGLSWAYDMLAPGVRERFAALREGQRLMAGCIDVRLGSVEQEIGMRLDRTDTRIEMGLREVNLKMSELSEMIAEYGADKRQEGYEAALRDFADQEPNSISAPTQRIPTNGHLHSV